MLKLLVILFITKNYLPGILNTTANWQSCHIKGFSERKLSPIVFQIIYQEMSMTLIELFGFR